MAGKLEGDSKLLHTLHEGKFYITQGRQHTSYQTEAICRGNFFYIKLKRIPNIYNGDGVKILEGSRLGIASSLTF